MQPVLLEVVDPRRRQPLAMRTPVQRSAGSRGLRDKKRRLTNFVRDLVFYGALEEFDQFRSKHLVLRAREIDSRGRVVALGWRGCCDGGEDFAQRSFHAC
jgi:hypothetical protein